MAHLLDMFPLIWWHLPFFVAVSTFQALCLVREFASRLERSLGIMDVAGVANPRFHPILSGIDADFKPRILPIIQHLSILLCLEKTVPEQGGPKNAVFGVSYMSLFTKTGASVQMGRVPQIVAA